MKIELLQKLLRPFYKTYRIEKRFCFEDYYIEYSRDPFYIQDKPTIWWFLAHKLRSWTGFVYRRVGKGAVQCGFAKPVYAIFPRNQMYRYLEETAIADREKWLRR